MTKELHEKLKQFEEKAGTDWFNKLNGITTTEQLIKAGTEYRIPLSEIQAQEDLNHPSDFVFFQFIGQLIDMRIPSGD